MHAKTYAPLLLGIAALSFACVSPAQESSAKPATASDSEAAPKDTTKFCYYANEAYSEGAELNGAVCSRNNTTTTFDSARARLPLKWIRNPENRTIQQTPADEN